MRAQGILFLEPKGTVLEVVRAAKARGLHVIALMADPKALESLPAPYDSALNCIDEIHQVTTWSDSDIVMNRIRTIEEQMEIIGVYFGVDPCAISASRIREYLGLPHTPVKFMELILNKRALRLKLLESGLSKLRSFSCNEVRNWSKWPLQGAAYFKPVHGSFSLFVKRCESLVDLEKATGDWENRAEVTTKYINDYLGYSREYHLEEAIEGELLSVEGIVSEGNYQVLGLTSRILFSKNQAVEMGSCFPYPHPLSEKIIDLVRRAHLALGFKSGPTHVEVIVGTNGEIEIIDFNPRFVGADVLQSINFAYGIKIEDALLDWALGKVPKITPQKSGFSCLQYVLSPRQMQFESLDLPKVPEVKFATFFPKPGQILQSVDRQIDYIGVYLTVMPGFKAAIDRSLQLRDQVKINGHEKGAY